MIQSDWARLTRYTSLAAAMMATTVLTSSTAIATPRPQSPSNSIQSVSQLAEQPPLAEVTGTVHVCAPGTSREMTCTHENCAAHCAGDMMQEQDIPTLPTETQPEVEEDSTDSQAGRRRHCNQGIGNGAEGCDPGNSRPHGGSNDEDGRTSGNRHPRRNDTESDRTSGNCPSCNHNNDGERTPGNRPSRGHGNRERGSSSHH
jgi:hypothetical protein